MTELTLRNDRSIIRGPFGPNLPAILVQLEGRKTWPNGNTLSFETTEFNVSILQGNYPDAVIVDERSAAPLEVSAFDFGQGVSKAGFALNEVLNADKEDFSAVEPSPWVKNFRLAPYDFQIACFEKFKDRRVGAIFSEQGTGKTKSAIDIISYKLVRKYIDAVLIVSWPKGVHTQWIEDQLPVHLWEEIKPYSYAWDGKKLPDWLFDPGVRNKFFSINVEALRHRKTIDMMSDFVEAHGDRCMVVVDESQTIKNASSLQWRALSGLTWRQDHHKLIMTGTPIAKDLTDEWSQFKWLDERIIGIRYKNAFEAQFCVKGGFENRQIISHRNVETFKKLTRPHIFRATKAELNLPEKTYDEIIFDLTPEQKSLIKGIKDNLSAAIDTGEITSAGSAVAGIVRMQQIANGFIVDDDGVIHWLKKNPRLEIVKPLIDGSTSKVVLWCRFRQDVEKLFEHLGPKNSAHYYGGTAKGLRIKNLEEFKNPDSDVRYLVASPAAAGSGIDGLQKVSSMAVYYSNSFNAIDRWQSEDRIHRIGMGPKAIYHDLIGRGSPDRVLINNLKKKKSLADLVLDDVKGFLDEI